MSISFSRQNLKQNYFRLRNRLKYNCLKSKKRKEIRNIYANNQLLKEFHLDNDLKKEIKRFWKKLGSHIDTMWHQAYINVNGIADHRYIPEDVFYMFIEPNLNRKDLYHAYVDKNNYDRLFPGVRTPRTLLRNINGKYYDGNYERLERNTICEYLGKYPGDYIVKPSIDSSSGKNIMKLQCHSQKIFNNGKCITFESIENTIKRDFLVQEFLEQQSILNTIYPHSLNTFRVVTLRINNDIHALQSNVKFGDKGQYVDYNTNQGGVNCGINKDGLLNQFAVDMYFNKHYKHPYTSTVFKNIQIPQFSSILNYAINLHRYLFYFDMVSWDLAIDKNEAVVLIELNLINQGFSFLQVHHGPLFGDFTEKIMEEKFKYL